MSLVKLADLAYSPHRMPSFRVNARVSSWRVAPVAVVLGLAAVLVLSGCKNTKPTASSDFYNPKSHPDQVVGSPGSIADIKAKTAARRAKAMKKAADSATVLILVSYDVSGKPVGLELRKGTGDDAVDARAQQMVFSKYRFPTGAPDTVLVEIDAKSIPRK